MIDVSLEDISRRLDDLQAEATSNRLVADVVMTQFKLLRADLEAQHAQIALTDHRLDRIEIRLDRIETKFDHLLTLLEARR